MDTLDIVEICDDPIAEHLDKFWLAVLDRFDDEETIAEISGLIDGLLVAVVVGDTK